MNGFEHLQELEIDTESTCSDFPSEDVGVEPEEMEGDEPITQPFDPTKTQIITSWPTVSLLVTRIQEQEIDLFPSFQRKAGLWSSAQKSRLIESLLLRMPLPSFYFDATDDENWVVVDGLQRLWTLQEFLLSDMRLHHLEFLINYENSTFKDLPRHLQRRIGETQVVAHLIQPGTPPQVKFNIFRRINTGGLVLSAQEIRHALNQGKAPQFLKKLACSKAFLEATQGSVRPDRMEDQEFVLRFIAFTIVPYPQYKIADLDGFLHEQMARLNTIGNDELEELEVKFQRAMRASRLIFGRQAFRKSLRDGLSAWRSPINKAIFEVWSVTLGQLTEDKLEHLIHRKDEVISRFIEVLKTHEEFVAAVSQGTGDVKKVKERFKTVANLVEDILNAN